MKKRFILIFSFISAVVICTATAFVLYANAIVNRQEAKIRSLDAVPELKVGLLLGVAKSTPRGIPNLYFAPRIRAASELYHAGKISHVLVSGDNGRKDYDEPNDMKSALMARGVPEKAITLDFAGFRTLDSVVRSKEVFGCKQIIIITQKGHLERALYLAEKNGIEAVGYAADEPDSRYAWLRIRNCTREFLARAAAVLDADFLHRKPKFYGDPVMIEVKEKTAE